MPDEMNDLFYQLPIVTVVLVIVWHFVKVLQKRDDSWLKTVKDRDAEFLGQLDKYETTSREIQKEVIDAFKEQSAMTARCVDVLDKVDKKLTREGFERERNRDERDRMRDVRDHARDVREG